MFDREKAIAEWRVAMKGAGMRQGQLLDELEGHLRDHMAQLARAGASEADAFQAAFQQIGRPGLLRNEFRKVERKTMKRVVLIVLGVLGFLFGTALICPAMAWYQRHGHQMPGEQLAYLLAGIIITIAGIGLGIFGFRCKKNIA